MPKTDGQFVPDNVLMLFHAAMVHLTKDVVTGGIVRLTPEDFKLYDSVGDGDGIALGIDPANPVNITVTYAPKEAQA